MTAGGIDPTTTSREASAVGYAPDWPAPGNVRSWQTTRPGGVSTGAWNSLNLGLHVGDDAAAVTSNRASLAAALALPAEPVWLDQVHGTHILDVDGRGWAPADGAVTRQSGVVLAVMTADCLPVLLASKDGTAIGVAHAGWRGLANGVLTAAVTAMPVAPSALLVWLGPAIGPAAFEVGDEVRAAFVDADPEAAVAFAPNARGRWQADLHWLARRQLCRAGVQSIYGNPTCTFAEPARYFSHRREAPCGRMASLIWREPLISKAPSPI
jgi:YfiH family protein